MPPTPGSGRTVDPGAPVVHWSGDFCCAGNTRRWKRLDTPQSRSRSRKICILQGAGTGGDAWGLTFSIERSLRRLLLFSELRFQTASWVFKLGRS